MPNSGCSNFYPKEVAPCRVNIRSNHIIWNSTTLDCTRKFRNFWGSTEAVRKLSDLVCMEHRLSVIENPKPHGKSYNKWLGGNAKPCQRDLLRVAIDAALAKKPKDFEIFLKLVEAAGYTVKRGKHITFMRDGQPQNTRICGTGIMLFRSDIASL